MPRVVCSWFPVPVVSAGAAVVVAVAGAAAAAAGLAALAEHCRKMAPAAATEGACLGLRGSSAGAAADHVLRSV